VKPPGTTREAPGIGIAFAAEVRKAVRTICEHPYRAVSVGSGIRKTVLDHFPYNILYAVVADLILIVAVAHQKRRPTYWRARTKQIKERKS